MNKEILEKLERRVGRRGFLSSGLATAAIFGIAGASSLKSFAQEPQQGDKKQEKPQQHDPKQDEGKDDKKNEKEQTKQDTTTDPYKVTNIDASGHEYRICPVCGSNMYRQDRTWTCENCGYSYEE
jgi:ribosomal protein S27AE